MPVEIITDEFDVAARLAQQFQIEKGRARTGVLVEVGHVMVNNKDCCFLLSALPCNEYCLGIGIVPGQYIGPFGCKLFVIGDLVFFQAVRFVGTVRYALKMNNDRTRLVVDFSASLTNAKRQIRILIVSGRQTFVEFAKFKKQFAGEHDSGP